MKTRVQKGDMTCPQPRALWVAALKFEPSALEQVGFVYCLVNKRHGGVGWHFSFGALGRAWKPGGGRRGQSSQKREEEGCRIRTLVNLKSTMVCAAGSALPYPTICLRANGRAEALAIGRTLPWLLQRESTYTQPLFWVAGPEPEKVPTALGGLKSLNQWRRGPLVPGRRWAEGMGETEGGDGTRDSVCLPNGTGIFQHCHNCTQAHLRNNSPG